MGIKRYLIVTFDEEDGSRESGNVYYCPNILISTDRDELQFNEPVFETKIAVSGDEGCTDAFIRQALELGYVVEDARRKFVFYETVFKDDNEE